MARKKKEPILNKNAIPNAYIENAGVLMEEKITETLEKNYMPYAMSVIISRALPEIDGFKPSHRKLLYTMYKMGLLNGNRTKSANVVGQTMRLNPHGDSAIYETMVRLSRGNETLLHPYVDSKGNFGKCYSRDMAYAASRYTEVKLDNICNELFVDIDKDTVDFSPNYDNTMLEPTLLPATFPSVLVNSNVGIAVSMASAVCPFNLSEVCETTIALIQNPEHDILSTLKAPDFPTGASIIYDETELKKIYDTGRGSVKIRSKYNYDKSANCIEVTEIPYSTTVEAIMDKIVELIKQGKIREVSYIRDETDLNGLKLAIDLKRGADPDKLMQKLYKLTPLQDNYSCNFNILIDGVPKVMGVREILNQWISFRENCVRRRLNFDLSKKQDRLHLLQGLGKILADIDKAIKIIRETQEENEVISNLMIGFSIDEIQAEYIAEIKLRHLNREYILNRLQEIDALEKDISQIKDTISDSKKVRKVIISELKNDIKKYGKPRKTELISSTEDDVSNFEIEIPNYNVHVFLSASGYFKKITPLSLRMSGEQKLKEGDYILQHEETTNKSELLFFSNRYQVYKAKAYQFDDTKASVFGDYIPAKLGFDTDETIVKMKSVTDFNTGFVLFVFENGKIAKVPYKSYETKTNRKKLANAYSSKSQLVDILFLDNDTNILISSNGGKSFVFNTSLILAKSSRDSIGVSVMNLKSKNLVSSVKIIGDDIPSILQNYVAKNIPCIGLSSKSIDVDNQLSLI
ncbi:MAG: DNA topoisomerase (ATP-hydrolyzing) subunit A [Oscillospiraceae bacterium]